MKYHFSRRAFTILSFLPISYFAYSLYQTTLAQLYLKPKQGGFNLFGTHYDPKKTVIERIRFTMGWMIHEALDDQKVTKEGLNFLDRMFRHPQSETAGLFLLTNVLQDARFIDASRIFGTNLIAHVIQQNPCQEEFKKLIVSTLHDDDVKSQVVEVVRFLSNNDKAEDIIAKLMTNVFLRQDILDNLTNLLVFSAESALNTEGTHQMLVEFLTRLVRNPELKHGVMETFVYSPTRSFFTFGYSSESSLDAQQKEWEQRMQAKRELMAATFIEDRNERNKYKPVD